MSRRSGDWHRLSAIRPDLPSSPRLASRIAVRAAWSRLVGDDLAARLPALERQGACLVIGVPSREWLQALPGLQARLARRFDDIPALRGVRRLDGRLDEERAAAPGLPVPRREAAPPAEDSPGSARARLEALAERLLARRD